MSLKGSAESGGILRGKINRLDELRGYSAYEIALIHGFKGSEEEWIESLLPDTSKHAAGHSAGGVDPVAIAMSQVNGLDTALAQRARSVNGVHPDGDGNVTLTPAHIGMPSNEDATAHIADKNNPHGVTAGQIGAVAQEAKQINSKEEITGSGFYRFADNGSVIPGETCGVLDLARFDNNFKGYIAHSITGKVYHGSVIDGVYGPPKELATTDYALPRDGNTAMTGDLTIEKAMYPSVVVRATQTGRMTQVQVAQAGETEIYNRDNAWKEHSRIVLAPPSVSAENRLKLAGFDGNAWFDYNIIHTGNKPSGSYTGNGSATSRTIETGGIGSAIAIWGNGRMVLLGHTGGFAADNGTVTGIKGSAAYFQDGNITIISTDDALNTSGATYNYQVL